MVRVIAYTTITLDGRIGVRGKRLTLSSSCDLERLHKFRSLVDAVMVGANTVINDDPLLTVRLPGYRGRQPARIIVDGKLRSPLSSRVFNIGKAPTIVLTSNISSEFKRRELMRKGVDVIVFNEYPINLRDALDKLTREYPWIKSILVEGGGVLLSQLIMEKLVSDLYIAITPYILGSTGVPLIPLELSDIVKLKLSGVYVCRCGSEIVLHYRLF